MKKRLISLLAMLAMLCTMVIVAMPTTVAADTYPAFSTYKSTSTEKEWSIKTPADWAAMRTVADAATTDYFEGYTFHLEGNVDFEFAKLLPMGNANANGAAFAGTINGHGYGFENVNLGTSGKTTEKDSTGTKDIHHAGLFFRLGKCEFIDFGLNSGLVFGQSGSVAGAISSFGRVMPGTTPKFTRVWSSLTIAAMSNVTGSGLVHTIERNDITVDVNGFVFDGEIIKIDEFGSDGQISFGVTGHTLRALPANNSFANIITDFASRNGKVTPVSGKVASYTETNENECGVRAALFNFASVANFQNANKGNIYAVKRAEKGIDDGYFLGFRSSYGDSGSEDLLTDMSAKEAAWTINTNQISGKEAVYYTLNDDGKVRPIVEGKQDGKIVKVTLTGARQEEYFFNAGTEVNLAEKLGKENGQTFTVGGIDITDATYIVDEDTEITVTSVCTNHTYDASSYVAVAGENEHTATCKACGIKVVEPCSADSYNQSIVTVDDLESGVAATHSGTCKFCTKAFTQNCDFTYEVKTKDYVWDYSCKCGRDEEIINEGVAPVLVGDANDNGEVDLFDALRLLKKVVNDNVEINERNADVDGDNDPDIKDVRKILLYYMNDAKIKAEFEATEERVNTTNYYNLEDATVGNLKMDGSEGTNDRYVRTEYISVSEGNKIVFGPVRMQQAVMGYFYDAQNKPLDLINHTNIEVEHTFEEGMIMASIIVPEGAAYVRMNVNAEEKDQFYIRINNDFTVFDYENVTKAESDALENPLKDQLVLNMGDSLADAGVAKRDPTPDGLLTGWSRRTKNYFGAKVVTSAQGGSTVSTIKYANVKPGVAIDARGCVVNQLNEHTNIGREYEYILLEGGGNDAGAVAGLGEVNYNSFDPNDFAPEDTYAGGLERLIYTAIKQHGDTAAMGYFIPYDMKYAPKAGIVAAKPYFELGKKICDKWGIKYLDLFEISTPDKNGNVIFNAKINDQAFVNENAASLPNNGTDAYDANGLTYDGIHCIDKGYDILFSYIKPFMLEMEPVSKDVYLEVQKYDPIPTIIGQK